MSEPTQIVEILPYVRRDIQKKYVESGYWMEMASKNVSFIKTDKKDKAKSEE